MPMAMICEVEIKPPKYTPRTASPRKNSMMNRRTE